MGASLARMNFNIELSKFQPHASLRASIRYRFGYRIWRGGGHLRDSNFLKSSTNSKGYMGCEGGSRRLHHRKPSQTTINQRLTDLSWFAIPSNWPCFRHDFAKFSPREPARLFLQVAAPTHHLIESRRRFSSSITHGSTVNSSRKHSRTMPLGPPTTGSSRMT